MNHYFIINKSFALYKKQNKTPYSWAFGAAAATSLFTMQPRDIKRAEKYYQQAKEYKFSDGTAEKIREWIGSAYYGQAWEQIGQGKNKPALQSLKKAIEYNNKNGDYYKSLGYILYDKLNNPKEALKYLKKADSRLKHDPVLYFYFAGAYTKLEDYETTMEYYDKSIQAYNRKGEKVPDWIWVNCGSYSINNLKKPDYKRAVIYLKNAVGGQAGPEQRKTALQLLSYAFFLLHDYENALYYGKQYDTDYWVYKQVSSKRITMTGYVGFGKVMKKHYPYHKTGIFRIVLPMNTYYQKFISFESTPAYKELIKDGRRNLAVYDFSDGFPDKLTVKIVVETKVADANPVNLQIYEDAEDEIGFYANEKTDFYNIDNPVLKKKVNEIAKGAGSVVEEVQAIHKHVADNITHVILTEEYKNRSLSGDIGANGGDNFMAVGCQSQNNPKRT